MEYPNKNKLKWKMFIGIALLSIISCCCLAVYAYFKIFPALALMLFPSHILTGTKLNPTETSMTPGLPTEIRTMLPRDLLEEKNRYSYLAGQIMRDCNQSVDDLSAVLDSAKSLQKPFDSEWIKNFGNKVDQFSIICSSLENTADPVPEGFQIFEGYLKKASKEVPQIVECFHSFEDEGKQDKYDEGVRHYSVFLKNLKAANKEYMIIHSPTPGN